MWLTFIKFTDFVLLGHLYKRADFQPQPPFNSSICPAPTNQRLFPVLFVLSSSPFDQTTPTLLFSAPCHHQWASGLVVRWRCCCSPRCSVAAGTTVRQRNQRTWQICRRTISVWSRILGTSSAKSWKWKERGQSRARQGLFWFWLAFEFFRLIEFKPQGITNTKDQSVKFAFLTKANELKFDVVADTKDCLADLYRRLSTHCDWVRGRGGWTDLCSNISCSDFQDKEDKENKTLDCSKRLHSLKDTGGYNFVVGNIWNNGQIGCKWHIELVNRRGHFYGTI